MNSTRKPRTSSDISIALYSCDCKSTYDIESLKRMTRGRTRGHYEEIGQGFGDFVSEATA